KLGPDSATSESWDMAESNEFREDAAPAPSTWVIQVGEQFEAAWTAGQQPAIEDFLPPGGSQRQLALLRLIHVDLERRLKAGEAARVENYLARFPELADDSQAALDLIAAEHRLRRAREPGGLLEEYLRRFPRWAGALPGLLRSAAE